MLFADAGLRAPTGVVAGVDLAVTELRPVPDKVVCPSVPVVFNEVREPEVKAERPPITL